MKKTIKLTQRTLFYYLLAVVALILMYAHANGQTWKPNPKYIKTSTDSARKSGKAQKYQCQGTTAKGLQCKRAGSTPAFYCYQHINQK